MSLNLVVAAETDEGTAYYNVHDATILGWSSHYGETGGGFGYLRFSLNRPVGYDYADIGYGYSVTLYKSLGQVLFDGMIRQIDERSSGKGDEISVTALGWVVVANDDELHQHYCDSRLGMWKPRYGEIPKTVYRPDLYTTGANNIGLFIHCNNNTTYPVGHQMVMTYTFNDEEDATQLATYEVGKRIKCTLDLVLGAGVAFDGDIIYGLFSAKINTVNDGTDTVVYKDDSNEDTVINGDTLRNITRDESATISSVTQATNTIVLGGAPDLSTWASDDSLEIEEGRFEYGNTNNHAFLQAGMKISNLTQGKEATISSVDKVNYLITVNSKNSVLGWEIGDEIFMPGPIFWASIDSITGADIDYTDAYGAANIQTSWPIVNMTKKAMAQVQSEAGITITVTDSDDIEKWEENDMIMQPVMYFYAQCDGASAGAVVTYKSEIGERLVENDAGWVLYNETQDEFATVQSWDTASSQITVTAAGDVVGWADNNILRIYTPFRFSIKSDDGTMLWPVTDWRYGAVMQRAVDIDINVTAGTTHFRVYLDNFIAGTANETTILQLGDLRVYNVWTSEVTPEYLATDVARILGPTNGHNLSDQAWDIESSLTNIVEPMVFEYTTPKEAMTWVCRFGDGAADPARTAWGVRLNTDRLFYLELQDLETVDYYVVRGGDTEIQSGGDIGQSAQRIQGIYTDVLGEEQTTAWYEDEDAYFSDQWRRQRVRLDGVDNADDAAIAMALYLKENKKEKRSASYRVSDGSIYNSAWVPVPFDEVKATGKLIKIQDGRLESIGQFDTDDARDSWITEQIVAVEVDYASKNVNLIPASSKKSFELYMAVLSRMSEK